MPVVGHQRLGKRLDRILRQTVSKNPFKGDETFLLLKQRLPPIAATEGVTDQSGLVITRLSRRGQLFRWRSHSKNTGYDRT